MTQDTFLASKNPWRVACEARIAQLESNFERGWPYPFTEPKRIMAHRNEVRRWRRRLFWAKYGYIRAAAIGATIGIAGGYGIVTALGFPS